MLYCFNPESCKHIQVVLLMTHQYIQMWVHCRYKLGSFMAQEYQAGIGQDSFCLRSLVISFLIRPSQMNPISAEQLRHGVGLPRVA